MGVIERIGSLAGTEMAKAVNLAHETFQDRVAEHGHTGRALIETLTEVCRNHPNAVGIGVGLLVEQLLVHEKHLHDARLHEGAVPGHPATPGAPAAHPSPDEHRLLPPQMHMTSIKPGKVAFEVFGALVVLKIGAGLAHLFGRKSHKEAWFAPAAKIHSISGSIAAYYLAKAIKSKNVSSWRNAAILLFGTHAVKPLLKLDRAHRTLARTRAAARTPPPAPVAPSLPLPPPPAAHAPEPPAAETPHAPAHPPEDAGEHHHETPSVH